MKFRDILISKDAELDLEEGENFFESVESGLGRYFFDCMLVEIESLKFFGGIHYKEYKLYRMNSKKFSHFIYYDIKDDLIYIMAILSMRQDPISLKEKIKKRV